MTSLPAAHRAADPPATPPYRAAEIGGVGQARLIAARVLVICRRGGYRLAARL